MFFAFITCSWRTQSTGSHMGSRKVKKIILKNDKSIFFIIEYEYGRESNIFLYSLIQYYLLINLISSSVICSFKCNVVLCCMSLFKIQWDGITWHNFQLHNFLKMLHNKTEQSLGRRWREGWRKKIQTQEFL